ncbi:MAG: type secretory pathway, pseudopilin PulG [Gammaproteobacteria bacterium]|nr:type secretory pathway, pseudopilin PulG [Gammaproteobacteria bacterium]
MENPSTPGSRMNARHAFQAGFTYIGLLVAVVIMGLLLTIVSRIWTVTAQRERETELLFAGDAIRVAIAGYFANGHQYPLSLQLLLADDRSPVPKRHLRRLYPDPMTGSPDWTLIYAPDGVGIMGVASSSTRAPIKRRNFPLIDVAFEDSDCYCEWQFVYVPRRVGYRKPAASP